MPDPQPQPWHLQPDIANLSPDSFTAQKLVPNTIPVPPHHVLTIAATCDAGASLPHIEALLHRPYPRTLPHTPYSILHACNASSTLTHNQRQHG